MIATITQVWFLTLPTLFAGLILLRKLRLFHEKEKARVPVPATVAVRK
jgi:hypothetical protein